MSMLGFAKSGFPSVNRSGRNRTEWASGVRRVRKSTGPTARGLPRLVTDLFKFKTQVRWTCDKNWSLKSKLFLFII